MFAELDARGVRSCGSSDVQTLQRMVLASASVKELAIINRNGQTLCRHRPIPFRYGASNDRIGLLAFAKILTCGADHSADLSVWSNSPESDVGAVATTSRTTEITLDIVRTTESNERLQAAWRRDIDSLAQIGNPRNLLIRRSILVGQQSLMPEPTPPSRGRRPPMTLDRACARFHSPLCGQWQRFPAHQNRERPSSRSASAGCGRVAARKAARLTPFLAS